MVQALWKTVWRLLKKLKMELPYDPAIQLLGINPKEMKTGYQGGIWSMFIAALIHNSQDIETTKCPSTNEWIRKMWCICSME